MNQTKNIINHQTLEELQMIFADPDDVNVDGADNYLQANYHYITCHLDDSQDNIIVTNFDGDDCDINVPAY